MKVIDMLNSLSKYPLGAEVFLVRKEEKFQITQVGSSEENLEVYLFDSTLDPLGPVIVKE